MITEAQLTAFIDREQESSARAWHERRARPVWEQVEAGELITGLTLEAQHGQEFWLRAPANESKFRRGDALLLRDHRDTNSVDVTFLEDSRVDARVKVRVYGRGPLPAQPWALESSLYDLSDRLKAAVTRVYSQPEQRTARALLEGPPRPEYEALTLRRYRQQGEALGLTEPQTEAFAHALACRTYTTIKGPPGSGKTSVIAQIVTQAVSEGQRVLITAHTHKAVNNVLSAVAKLRGRFPVQKYGHPDMAAELPDTVERVHGSSGPALLSEPGVVGAVLVAAAGLTVQNAAFDLVLCDEASQVTLSLAACGLVAGRRWVFVGDERQLPPVLTASHGEDPCARSVFAHLYSEGTGIMLTQTFRMNKGLTAWVSREFYGGHLKADMRAALRQLRLREGGAWQPLLDPTKALVIALIDHDGNHDESPEEAQVVAALVHELHTRHGFALKDVGVVAPFRAQNRRIRAAVEGTLGQVLGRGEHDLLIDTVERAQGQEREVILVSLTSSDPDYVAGIAGFLLSEERLNVAVTRARTKCVLLMSPQLLQVRSANLDHLRLLNRLHRMVRELPVVTLDPAASALPHPAPAGDLA